MRDIRDINCPRCDSGNIVKNGNTAHKPKPDLFFCKLNFNHCFPRHKNCLNGKNIAYPAQNQKRNL